MTRQEMFDRAWRGLKDQGWKRAMNAGGSCLYLDVEGRRCAWGHVDPDGTVKEFQGQIIPNGGDVVSLSERKVGLAGTMNKHEVRTFAVDLQEAHDHGFTPETMEANMRAFAVRYGLVVPEEAGQ